MLFQAPFSPTVEDKRYSFRLPHWLISPVEAFDEVCEVIRLESYPTKLRKPSLLHFQIRNSTLGRTTTVSGDIRVSCIHSLDAVHYGPISQSETRQNIGSFLYLGTSRCYSVLPIPTFFAMFGAEDN